MEIETGPLLKTIDAPEDLRKLDVKQLKALVIELRKFIIDVVSLHGGHLGASLGVVELTVALHYVFDTPEDLLVWDVGHQAYGHKILTGRRSLFETLRKKGGISGFPNRAESPFDAFGTGHASTSVSAVLGMALADKQLGKDGQHIAVIGDGALSGGMAFEALNQAGSSDTNLLIILNDNHISIDPDVGALRNHLNDLLHVSPSRYPGSRIKRSRYERNGNNLFKALHFKYFGPSDGNDLEEMLTVLEQMKRTPGPKVLHISTLKGKGYAPAEKDQITWHAPGLFNKRSGEIRHASEKDVGPMKYQDVFGYSVLELAKKNPKIMAITPAMPSGSSLKYMMKEMPDRALDVGIAEQHAVTLSAGMACRGMKVFCCIYSTFLQRAYDQIIHDVAIQDLPVIFCVDRAGLVGEDGATHQGIYDLAFMRSIPHMIVSAPMNESELRNLMYTAQLASTVHPMSIRYPRGRGVQKQWQTPFEEIPIGKGRKISDGENVAVLSLGHPGNTVQKAIGRLEKEGIRPAHFDMRFAKPLDENLLRQIFRQFEKIVTVEEGVINGGFGSAVLQWAGEHGFQNTLKILAVPDRCIPHATTLQQQEEAGIDEEGIIRAIREMAS